MTKSKNTLRFDFSMTAATEKEVAAYREGLDKAWNKLNSGQEDYTGWVSLPCDYDKAEFARIKAAAKRMKNQCEALVVIGIGGSYLGLRAAVAMLDFEADGPEIYYAGINISGTYHKEIMEAVKDKDICLCIISKSGTTTEPSIAFALFKDLMYQKYGREEANQRIYAITDKEKGTLRAETDAEGYESFIVPDAIGGRYSVLTPVGLLPIAGAGIDIDAMMEGAKAAAEDAELKKAAEQYAVFRNEMYKQGKVIEVFEYYEPRLQYFAEWLKQLLGESEGKDGVGIFPAALQFSADLHSMGQFLQDGNQIFFETVLNVCNPPEDMLVPESAGAPLAGKSMNEVNQAAVTGVIAAHRQADVPIFKIDIDELSPYTFGYLVYFYETACALSCYLMGVQPFDQPGVESYKAEMRKALK